MLARSPPYSDSDESIISTNSVQVWGQQQIFLIIPRKSLDHKFRLRSYKQDWNNS